MYGAEVQTVIDVWMRGPRGFERRLRSRDGSCRAGRVDPDRFEARGEVVTIPWNTEEVKVPDVRVHRRSPGDAGVIEVPGAGLAPLAPSDVPVRREDPLLFVAAAREPSGSGGVRALRQVGLAGAAVGADSIPVAAPLAPAFRGGPVLDGNGRVAGMVIATEGPAAACLPIGRIAGLLK